LIKFHRGKFRIICWIYTITKINLYILDIFLLCWQYSWLVGNWLFLLVLVGACLWLFLVSHIALAGSVRSRIHIRLPWGQSAVAHCRRLWAIGMCLHSFYIHIGIDVVTILLFGHVIFFTVLYVLKLWRWITIHLTYVLSRHVHQWAKLLFSSAHIWYLRGSTCYAVVSARVVWLFWYAWWTWGWVPSWVGD